MLIERDEKQREREAGGEERDREKHRILPHKTGENETKGNGKEGVGEGRERR